MKSRIAYFIPIKKLTLDVVVKLKLIYSIFCKSFSRVTSNV